MILAKYILVDESQRKKLSDHAKNSLPNESCAILLGITNGEKITLKKSVIVENADASPVEFSIKPDQLFSTYANAEKDGLEVIGIFHSHPTSRAEPSETDKKFMMINPGVWLIYSQSNDEFAAYGMNNDKTTYKISMRAPLD